MCDDCEWVSLARGAPWGRPFTIDVGLFGRWAGGRIVEYFEEARLGRPLYDDMLRECNQNVIDGSRGEDRPTEGGRV